MLRRLRDALARRPGLIPSDTGFHSRPTTFTPSESMRGTGNLLRYGACAAL
jgi:hypothetical protein